jgi:hypothetical protein
VATYSQTTLGFLTTQVSTILDDLGAVYWTVPEIQYALWEALRVWGALTNYWRARGAFTFSPASSSPFVDLSQALPALRTRSWTFTQVFQEIAYALLEPVGGGQFSGQVSPVSLTYAISRARNRFVRDVRFPISIHEQFGGVPPNPSGTISFPQSSVFVHRAQWQDQMSGKWTNLWRQDEWALDHGNPSWTVEPGSPLAYSESMLAPLTIQLSPAPSAIGSLETLTVDSLEVIGPLGIPDEWSHAVKWGALSELLTAESQLHDPLRAQYAEQRYQQAVTFAQDARSILRLQLEGVPLPIDAMANIDAGIPYWRNTSGVPYLAGVLYDIVCPVPGIPSRVFGATADVVQSAPIPLEPANQVPIGREDLDHIIDYATHILAFKCGGKDFTDTMPGYDGFMKAVSSCKGVNAAKIQYLTPLFAQPQMEWAVRPDRLMVNQ